MYFKSLFGINIINICIFFSIVIKISKIKIILLTYSGEPVEATKEAVFVPHTHKVHHSSGEEQ